MNSFGDTLFNIVLTTKQSLWLQGEMAELSFSAFTSYIDRINVTEHKSIVLNYPIGMNADDSVMHGKIEHSKEALINRMEYLRSSQLPLNGIYQLVTTMESAFYELLKNLLIKYPVKIPNKRKLDVGIVLEAESLEEIRISIIDSLLNEIAYKSPKEFAEEFARYTSINLLEKPAYHRYIELKATRDIHIHNSGIANPIYLAKADTLSRVQVGEQLPVDITYFLRCYEACLQICEILEKEFPKNWPSESYNQYREHMKNAKSKNPLIEEAIEEAIGVANNTPTKVPSRTTKKERKSPSPPSKKR